MQYRYSTGTWHQQDDVLIARQVAKCARLYDTKQPPSIAAKALYDLTLGEGTPLDHWEHKWLCVFLDEFADYVREHKFVARSLVASLLPSMRGAHELRRKLRKRKQPAGS